MVRQHDISFMQTGMAGTEARRYYNTVGADSCAGTAFRARTRVRPYNSNVPGLTTHWYEASLAGGGHRGCEFVESNFHPAAKPALVIEGRRMRPNRVVAVRGAEAVRFTDLPQAILR